MGGTRITLKRYALLMEDKWRLEIWDALRIMDEKALVINLETFVVQYSWFAVVVQYSWFAVVLHVGSIPSIRLF